MAIPAAMNNDHEKNDRGGGGGGVGEDDEHEHDMAEISLCRVYKRPGVEDYSNRGSSHHLPRSLPATRASSSRAPPRDPGIDCREKEALLQPHHTVDISLDTGRGLQQPPLPPLHQHSMVGQMNAFETGHRRHQGGSGSSSNVAVGLLPRHHPVNPSYKSTTDGGDYDNYSINHAVMVAPPAGVLPTPIAKEHREPPPAAFTYQQPVPSPLSSSAAASSSAVLQDELHRLVNYYTAHHSPSSHHHHLATLLMTGPQPHPQQQQLRAIWEWNQAVQDPDYNPDNSNTFK
ncbi:hypothetical protein SAY87_027427 [Trapa incisa]|uniref:Uncharacterized protein n=1 Tax=Trapa incisa TaxID=236973 RepID=A0AAN7JMI6_9MYRT|nr:hypothetical protein SAY87_027427 [Trapa incisa]